MLKYVLSARSNLGVRPLRYREFQNDPMMRKLHDIRRQDYLRFKDVPAEEALAIRRRELLEKLARDGWTLVPVEPGILRLKKVRRKRPRLEIKGSEENRGATT